MPTPRSLRTLVVHTGEARLDGAVAAPTHRSSTYALGEPESFDDIRYIRLNNTPTQRAVEAKLGALERGDALVTPSGTAAVWLALNAVLEPGAHVLAPRRVYGGTRKILDHLVAREGIRVSYVDTTRPAEWSAALRAETRAFFVETLANPWMLVPELGAVASFCRERGLTSVIDNTLATPVLYRPREHGFDVVVHSASKHLNGHTDVVAGVVVAAPERLREIRVHANRLGICPDPEACALLARGLKTLPLRVLAQCEAAQALAEALDRHPEVERVRYPGLPADPSHARAHVFRSERGAPLFGTMLAFRARGGVARARALINALELAIEAPSLGGVETLVTRPSTTSHAGLSAATRRAMGIDDETIRISVGVEEPSDLIADFHAALASSRGQHDEAELDPEAAE